MATDAAFAIAALALLGDRVGVGAKLFLVTIAVVDDVAAIVVIAVVYTSDVSPRLARRGRRPARRRRRDAAARGRPDPPYVFVGVLVWVATLESGVHATIAGVALAFLTPARPVNGRTGDRGARGADPPLDQLPRPSALRPRQRRRAARRRRARARATAPSIAVAVAVALLVGKLVGISERDALAVRLRLGVLPEGVDMRSVIGIAALGGIGFTVSLFIAALSFDDPCSSTAPRSASSPARCVSAAIGVAILAPGGRHPSRE